MTDKRFGKRNQSIWEGEEAIALLTNLIKERKSVDECVKEMNSCGWDVNRNMLIGKINRMRNAGETDLRFNSQGGKNQNVARAKRIKSSVQRREVSKRWWIDKKPGEKNDFKFRDLDMYSLSDLNKISDHPEDCCKWPIAEDDEGIHRFCPRASIGHGKPYCQFHDLASTGQFIRSADKFR